MTLEPIIAYHQIIFIYQVYQEKKQKSTFKLDYFNMANKKQQLKKQEIQNVASSKKSQTMREWITAICLFNNTDLLLENIKKEVKANNGEIKGLSREFYTNLKKAGLALGLSTHMLVTETVREEYRTFLVEMIKDIEREYGCKTAIEKALAETIASSYVRTLEYSRDLILYTKDNHLTHEKNGYYNMLSKEIDRAHRIFLNASMTLKQLKSPSMEINIKAKTAFVGQNQQFNNKNEINDQQ